MAQAHVRQLVGEHRAQLPAFEPSGSITQRIQLQATVMRPDTSTDAPRGAAAVRMRLLRAMSSQSEASERM